MLAKQRCIPNDNRRYDRLGRAVYLWFGVNRTMLRTMVKRALRKTGYQVSARKPGFADLMRHHGIATVLDVGANEGQYGAEMREHGFAGDIISFEPIAAVHDRLLARANGDARWTAVHAGMGDRDERRSINVSDATVFSSFLGLSEYSADTFDIARTMRTEDVDVVRLDSYLARNPLSPGPAYLKIDTQGFEKQVLVGAGESLGRFTLVQAELAVRQLYQTQDDWLHLVRWMAERGFRVVAAKENGYDHGRAELLELDIVFLNDR